MTLTEWVIYVMEQLGYIGIALLMFLDNVFPPIPSELIMPTAGYTASRGQLTFIGVVIAGCVGSLLAAVLLYVLGRHCPQQQLLHWVERYGKYIRITPKDIETALLWFHRYGPRIVFFGRMIPAVRSLISIPAGMSGMPFWQFFSYSALGTLLWTFFLTWLGYYFGENQDRLHEILSRVSYVGIGIAVLIVLYIILRRYKKST